MQPIPRVSRLVFVSLCLSLPAFAQTPNIGLGSPQGEPASFRQRLQVTGFADTNNLQCAVTATTPIAILNQVACLGSLATSADAYPDPEVAAVNLPDGQNFVTVHVWDQYNPTGVTKTIRFDVYAFTRGDMAFTEVAAGKFYSKQLIAFGGLQPYQWRYTGSLPSDMAVSSTGLLRGTPGAAGTYNFTLYVKDANNVELSQPYSMTVSSISIDTPNIIPVVAIAGQAYSFQILASGGDGSTKNYTVTGGNLPQNITLSPTGLLSGTSQSTDGNGFPFQVQVSDATSSATRQFILYVKMKYPQLVTLPAWQQPLEETERSSQPAGAQFAPTGGTPPYTCGLAPGSVLPPGMQLVDSSTAQRNLVVGALMLVGSPTAAGSFFFQMQCQDAAGVVTRQQFQVNSASIGYLAGNVRNPTENQSFQQQLMAAGGTPPYTYALSSGWMPTGMGVSSSGLLSGTPTSTGNYYSLLFRVTDAAGNTAVRSYGFTVMNADSSTPLCGDSKILNLTLGTYISRPFTCSGATSYTLVSGSLPPGINLVTRFLQGIPTQEGQFNFNIRVQDGTGKYAIFPNTTIVSQLQSLDPYTLPAARVGSVYQYKLQAVGGTPPYTFTTASTGSDMAGSQPFPPQGLTVSPQGTVSGIPTVAGVFKVGLKVSDSVGRSLIYPVQIPIAMAGQAMPLTPPSTIGLAASVNQPFIYKLDDFAPASPNKLGGGQPPFTWTVTAGSSLPSWLNLKPGNPANGLSAYLYGTPPGKTSPAFTLTVTDNAGQTVDVPFTMFIGNLATFPDPLPAGMVGTPYQSVLSTIGGKAPYIYYLASGSSLPPGLALGPGGVVSGTPLVAGQWFVMIAVTDSMTPTANTNTKYYTLTVDSTASPVPVLSSSPRTMSLYYYTGDPTPAPIPLTMSSSSVQISYNCSVNWAAGLGLSFTAGTTPAAPNLIVTPASLAPGLNEALILCKGVNYNTEKTLIVQVNKADPGSFPILGVSPVNEVFSAAGGQGRVSIETVASGVWTPSTTSSWIAITGPGPGQGVGTIEYTVAPNTTGAERVGTITIFSRPPVTITQAAAGGCSYALKPNTLWVPRDGLTTTFSVVASDPSCAWTMTSGDTFMVDNSAIVPASGSGSVTVRFTVKPNGSVPNTKNSFLSLNFSNPGPNQKPMNLKQDGHFLSLTNGSLDFSSSGGPGWVFVAGPSGAPFGTTSYPGWIVMGNNTATIPPGEPGALALFATANSSAQPRSGTMIVAGQALRVNQAGVPCNLSVDAGGGLLFGPSGGSGSLAITSPASDCAWTASSGAPWATVSAASGMGNGSVGIAVAAASGDRTTSVTVGGVDIPVRQTCAFQPPTTQVSAAAPAASGTMDFVGPGSCTITAAGATQAWLTWSVTQAGASPPRMQWSATANSGSAARSVTVTALGASIVFTQAGATPAWSFSSISGSYNSSGGGSGSFGLAAGGAASAPALSTDSTWISSLTLASGFNSSTGSGQVTFTTSANTGAPRQGQIGVDSQIFTVLQSGPSCYVVDTSATPAGLPLQGGTGQLRVTMSSAGCSLSASGVGGVVSVDSVVNQGGGVFAVNFTATSWAVARVLPIMIASGAGSSTTVNVRQDLAY